jgi:outer membrane receptor protein involved in Fe transport
MTDALRLRSMLALGVSVAALALAAPAFAANDADAPAAKDDNTIQPVIVTASGRAAAVQDVPIAISAVTADTLKNANVTDLKGLTGLVPSYKLEPGQSNAAGASATIRGIGTGGDNAGFESAVGFFIDGVYRNRAGVALSELPEVERIEVLNGPQGTLFGKNTSAGAISVTTKAPNFKGTTGFIEGTVGNYNDRKVLFGVNTALVADVLAVRLDGSWENRDGYIKDVNSSRAFNDKDRYSLRGQALWQINPDATLRVIADVSHTNEQCCVGLVALNGTSAAAVNGLSALAGVTGIPTFDQNNFHTAITPARDYLERVDDKGLSAELNWNVQGVKVSSITSYRDWKVLRDQDIDFSGLDRAYRQGYTDEFKTFTQEVRFQGKTDKLNWLFGGFYSDEILPHKDNIKFGTQAAQYVDALAGGGLPGYNIFGSLGTAGCGPAAALFPRCRALTAALYQGTVAKYTPLLGAAGAAAAAQGALGGPAGFQAYGDAVAAGAPLAGTGQNNDTFKQTTNSASIFTHDEYQITDKLKLTVGLRYNRDEKNLSAGLSATAPGCGALIANPAFAAYTSSLLANPGLASLLTLVCNPVVNTIADGAYKTSSTEDAVTGTVSLSYKVTDDVMTYGGYSRGYKSGGYNLDRSGFNITPASTVKPTTADLHFNPEYTDAYEFGIKSTINRSTQLNLNVFYEEVSDFQSNNFSGFNFVTRNIPTTISKGVEVSLLTRPLDGLTLQGGLLYNNAKYGSTVNFGPGYTILSGTTIEGDSVWTATASATYRTELPFQHLTALYYIDGRFNSPYQTSALNPSGVSKQGQFTVINGRIGISPPNERWSLELFARNLLDQYYIVGSFAVPEQNNYAVYPGEPRTFGATMRVKY